MNKLCEVKKWHNIRANVFGKRICTIGYRLCISVQSLLRWLLSRFSQSHTFLIFLINIWKLFPHNVRTSIICTHVSRERCLRFNVFVPPRLSPCMSLAGIEIRVRIISLRSANLLVLSGTVRLLRSGLDSEKPRHETQRWEEDVFNESEWLPVSRLTCIVWCVSVYMYV